jgi:hypothetical protein
VIADRPRPDSGHGGASLLADPVTFLAVRLVFSELKKLSMAELPQTSPARLILQEILGSLSSSWKCSLVTADGRRRPPIKGIQLFN